MLIIILEMKNNNIHFRAELISSVDIPKEILNQLHVALFATQILIFIVANCVVHQLEVFIHSAWIAITCIQVSALMFMFSRMLSSITWGLALTYILLFLLAFSQSTLGLGIGILLGCGSVLYTIIFLRVSKNKIPSILLMAATATVAILGTKNAYTSFDMLPRLHIGEVNQDTLFHASIAAMIKSYGVVSTGLHGLVETPYHIFSHAMMAGISLLSGQSIIETYGVANWMLFSPILIFSITFVSAVLDEKRKVLVEIVWSFSSLILLLMPRFFEKWAFWDSYFVSESYLVSLGAFLVCLPLLYKKEINFLDLILICLASFLISLSKATVGIVFAGLWLARIVFVRGGAVKQEISAFFIASLIVFEVVQSSFQGHSNQILFKLFGFLMYSSNGVSAIRLGSYLTGDSLILWGDLVAGIKAIFQFELFHFLFSWLVVFIAIYQVGIRNIFRIPLAVYVLSSAFAGILVTGAFAIPDGSAYYVSNIAFFVAIPGVGIYISCFFSFKEKCKEYILAMLFFMVLLSGAGVMLKSVERSNMATLDGPNELIDSLVLIRENAEKDVAYRYALSNFSTLPIERCTAQPFLFPAVSERAWLDVIRPTEKCEFLNYSYEQYGFRSGHLELSRAPVLSKGLKIVNYPN